ncbi:unnamed protein product [Hymenolepis diminuta]|uniref:Ovule protein n=1 Tax=Hymenolepis diminuta TaxID=6216 RepID=A0A0R3SX26_HYMDI|nr:unnamed protein product [Hymenolepis diminuta]
MPHLYFWSPISLIYWDSTPTSEIGVKKSHHILVSGARPLTARKLNLPKAYSRTYEFGESRERMQPLSLCCRNPSFYYSYSADGNRFPKDSALS